MEEFLTIKKYSHEAPFRELLHLLEEHAVPYQTELHRARIEPIGMTTLPPEFIVRVQPASFSRVNELLHDTAASEVLSAEGDHYLFAFKDEELFDILASPDEWSAYDYQLARRILRERDIDVDTKLLELLKKSRMQELAQPEEKQTANVQLGYLFALLGGVVGLFIGWNMTTARKTLPNGERLFVFQESDRRHGKWITGLSVISLIFWLLFVRMQSGLL